MGHEVAVFTGFPSRLPLEENQRFDSYEHDGITVERYHHARVPMGSQSNIMEMEYNILFVASYFRKYLALVKPDIVHFFHLQRLSASLVDVCRSLDIPMVPSVLEELANNARMPKSIEEYTSELCVTYEDLSDGKMSVK